jgi:hypothetical protein
VGAHKFDSVLPELKEESGYIGVPFFSLNIFINER